MKASLIRRIWVAFTCHVIGFYSNVLNKFEIHGIENVPKEGGILLLSNHISSFETVFLPWSINRYYPLQMVWAPAKEELFKNPITGLLYKSWGAFPVKRKSNSAGKVVISTVEELLKTDKVMLFPEGTRNVDAKLGKGNRGVGKIIYDARPIVIPVTFIGINRWSVLKLAQKGKVIFDKPVVFDDLFQLENNKTTQQAIIDRVMEKIQINLDKETTIEKS